MQYWSQERKATKSSTVGAYFRRIVSRPNQGTNFFQQFRKRMKDSLDRGFGRSADLLELPEQPSTLGRPQDDDWVFFRGFGGKSPIDLAETNPIYDVPRPQAPPRRKKERLPGTRDQYNKTFFKFLTSNNRYLLVLYLQEAIKGSSGQLFQTTELTRL